ncbi:hypothetical protein M3J09_010129 [Ascochyta lentis]
MMIKIVGWVGCQRPAECFAYINVFDGTKVVGGEGCWAFISDGVNMSSKELFRAFLSIEKSTYP